MILVISKDKTSLGTWFFDAFFGLLFGKPDFLSFGFLFFLFFTANNKKFINRKIRTKTKTIHGTHHHKDREGFEI